MKFVNALRRNKRFTLIALLTAAILGLGVGWSMAGSRNQDGGLSRAEIRRSMRAQLREGIGREVRFRRASEQEARDSVESVANFIRRRSGLELSAQLREQLVTMERPNNGNGRRGIKPEELTDILTDTALERLAQMSDAEIEQAAAVLSRGEDMILLRANGRGFTTPAEFVAQAKAMREQSRQNDAVLRRGLRLTIGREVNDRIEFLSDALPAQFGGVRQHGLSPSQAVVVTYSVVSDDLLGGSQESMRGRVAHARHLRQSIGAAVTDSDRAYGAGGQIYSTPLNLVLDESTLTKLLDRMERSRQQ